MQDIVNIAYSMPSQLFPYVLEQYSYRVPNRNRDIFPTWRWVEEPTDSREVPFYDDYLEVLEKVRHLTSVLPGIPFRITNWDTGVVHYRNTAAMAVYARQARSPYYGTLLTKICSSTEDEVDWLREGF